MQMNYPPSTKAVFGEHSPASSTVEQAAKLRRVMVPVFSSLAMLAFCSSITRTVQLALKVCSAGGGLFK